LTTRSYRIQERSSVASKSCTVRCYAGEQWDAFPVGEGYLVDSVLLSKKYDA
jgi:hypothetical protein